MFLSTDFQISYVKDHHMVDTNTGSNFICTVTARFIKLGPNKEIKLLINLPSLILNKEL